MKDGRFWIKLTDEFMNSKQIRLLERQADGHSYILLLIHLLRDTKDSDGVLAVDMGDEWQRMDAAAIHDEHPSFTAEFIGKALHKFVGMGLLEESDDGILQFSDYEGLTDTKSAAKQKRYRNRLKARENGNDVSNESGNNVTNVVTNNVTQSKSQSQSQRKSQSQSPERKQNQSHKSSSSSSKGATDDANSEDAADEVRSELRKAGINLDDELYRLIAGNETGLILYAIRKTNEAKPNNPTAYFRTTFKSYLERGYTRLSDVERAEQAREQQAISQAKAVSTAIAANNPALNYHQREYSQTDYDALLQNDWLEEYRPTTNDDDDMNPGF